jgi:hypothetical protein
MKPQLRQALKGAKKEEKKKIPSVKELEHDDKKFFEQAKRLRELLTKNPPFLRKRKR